jgi:hypothetical protein
MPGIKHQFTSALPDPTNAALVKPSNWNDNHLIDAVGVLVGDGTNLTGVAAGLRGQLLRRTLNTANVNYEFFSDSPVVSTNYAFTVTGNGNSLTGPGSVTFTPAFMPYGLSAASVGTHYLRIFDGVTSEVVLVTGWTSTTISFSYVNSYTGSWQLQTATAGLQEAIYANVGNTIYVPSGTHLIYQRTSIPRSVNILGAGTNATILQFQVATIDMFVTSGYDLFLTNFHVNSSSAWQTAGAIVRVSGASPTSIQITDVRTSFVFDTVYADWTQGLISINGLYARAQVRHIVYHASTASSALQMQHIFADGRYRNSPELLSPALFVFKGIISGLTFDNFWLQAATIHFDIQGVPGVPTNELIFGYGILDQDSTSTACVRINNSTGVINAPTNAITFTGTYFNTVGGNTIAIYNYTSVSLDSCFIRYTGSDAAILLSNTEDIIVQNCRIVNNSPAATRIIRCAGAVATLNRFANNFIRCLNGNVTAFIEYAASTVYSNLVDSNQCYGPLSLISGSPTVGQVIVKNNYLELYGNTVFIPYVNPYPIPTTDEAYMIIMIGTGTVTRMTGGYANRIVRILTQGPTSFNTGGTNPGDIGRSITTVANQVVTFIYDATFGIWFPVN